MIEQFFGMIRIGSDADIGMIRKSSDWLGMNFYPIYPIYGELFFRRQLSKLTKFMTNIFSWHELFICRST